MNDTEHYLNTCTNMDLNVQWDAFFNEYFLVQIKPDDYKNNFTMPDIEYIFGLSKVNCALSWTDENGFVFMSSKNFLGFVKSKIRQYMDDDYALQFISDSFTFSRHFRNESVRKRIIANLLLHFAVHIFDARCNLFGRCMIDITRKKEKKPKQKVFLSLYLNTAFNLCCDVATYTRADFVFGKDKPIKTIRYSIFFTDKNNVFRKCLPTDSVRIDDIYVKKNSLKKNLFPYFNFSNYTKSKLYYMQHCLSEFNRLFHGIAELVPKRVKMSCFSAQVIKKEVFRVDINSLHHIKILYTEDSMKESAMRIMAYILDEYGIFISSDVLQFNESSDSYNDGDAILFLVRNQEFYRKNKKFNDPYLIQFTDGVYVQHINVENLACNKLEDVVGKCLKELCLKKAVQKLNINSVLFRGLDIIHSLQESLYFAIPYYYSEIKDNGRNQKILVGFGVLKLKPNGEMIFRIISVCDDLFMQLKYFLDSFQDGTRGMYKGVATPDYVCWKDGMGFCAFATLHGLRFWPDCDLIEGALARMKSDTSYTRKQMIEEALPSFASFAPDLSDEFENWCKNLPDSFLGKDIKSKKGVIGASETLQVKIDEWLLNTNYLPFPYPFKKDSKNTLSKIIGLPYDIFWTETELILRNGQKERFLIYRVGHRNNTNLESVRNALQFHAFITDENTEYAGEFFKIMLPMFDTDFVMLNSYALSCYPFPIKLLHEFMNLPSTVKILNNLSEQVK